MHYVNKTSVVVEDVGSSKKCNVYYHQILDEM